MHSFRVSRLSSFVVRGMLMIRCIRMITSIHMIRGKNMRTKLFIIIGLALFCSASAWAITITPGPGNFPGDDNVLFNDPSLMHDGTLVQGNFNGSGNGFIVDFMSSSNDMMLH